MTILHENYTGPVCSYRRQAMQLPGDYKPVDLRNNRADILARVYALILSWSTDDPDAVRQEEKTA